MPRPLLCVFSLNGALVQRVRPAVAVSMAAPASVEQHSLGIHKVFVRPGVRDGLRRLLASGHVTLGVWSSTTMRNTEPIVKQVFADVDFKFVWSRDHTTPDAYRRQASIGDSESDHSTLKDVSLLWRYRVAGDGFGPKNTVLVDDEPSKSRRFADNLLWLPTYNVEDSAAAAVDESMGFNGMIDLILQRLCAEDTADVRSMLPHRVVLPRQQQTQQQQQQHVPEGKL